MFKQLFEANGREYKIYYSGDAEGSMNYKAKDEKEAERKFKADKNFKVGVQVTVDTVELVEKANYEVYHSTYTSAIQTAEAYAKKQGYDLNSEEMATEIGMGPGKPKNGKTVKHSLALFKNGQQIKGKKRLQIQVYDRGQTGNRYELNCYIS